MSRSRNPFQAFLLVSLVALGVAALAEPAQAGLFNRRPNVIVVPSTSYVVADPYVVTSSYVAVPTRTVVEVPAARVIAAPVERVVVPSTRVYAVPTQDVYVVPSSRVYTVPEVVVPTVRSTRVLVPSTRVIELYP